MLAVLLQPVFGIKLEDGSTFIHCKAHAKTDFTSLNSLNRDKIRNRHDKNGISICQFGLIYVILRHRYNSNDSGNQNTELPLFSR